MLLLNFENGEQLKYLDLSNVIQSYSSVPSTITIEDIPDELNSNSLITPYSDNLTTQDIEVATIGNRGNYSYLKNPPTVSSWYMGKFSGVDYTAPIEAVSTSFFVSNTSPHYNVIKNAYGDLGFIHWNYDLTNDVTAVSSYARRNIGYCNWPSFPYQNTYYPQQARGYTYLFRYKNPLSDGNGNVGTDVCYGLMTTAKPIEKKTYRTVQSTTQKIDGVSAYLRYRPSATAYVDDLIIISLLRTNKLTTAEFNDRTMETSYILSLFSAITNSTTEEKEVERPMANAINSGFYKIYSTQDMSQIKALNDAFWSEAFWESFQNYNMTDAILSFGFMPLDMPAGFKDDNNVETIKPMVGLSPVVKIAGRTVASEGGSPILMPYVVNQFPFFKCGSAYYGGVNRGTPLEYLDYSPYSKLIVKLPYVGTYNLEVNDYLHRFITVGYYIDLLTGSCVANIYRSKNTYTFQPAIGPTFPDDYEIVNSYNGNCLITVPISSNNMAQQIRELYGLLNQGVQQGVSAVGNALKSVSNPSSVFDAASDYMSLQMTANEAEMVTAPPVTVNYSGSNAGVNGLLQEQELVFITIAPNLDTALINDYISYNGWATPNSQQLNASTLSKGFYKIRDYKSVDTGARAGMVPSLDEQNEMFEIMKRGFFVL